MDGSGELNGMEGNGGFNGVSGRVVGSGALRFDGDGVSGRVFGSRRVHAVEMRWA